MKTIVLLLFLVTASLVACTNSAGPRSSPQSEMDDVETDTAAEDSSPSREVDDVSPTPVPATPTLTGTELESEESEGADADVLFVEATLRDNGSWTFAVTVEHEDTGWEDYADGWDVVLPDGTVVKPDPDSPFTRLLLHPHENEQPFTRSQSGILIPPGINTVTVRAHDIEDGFGGKEVAVDLTAEDGADFEVIRQ